MKPDPSSFEQNAQPAQNPPSQADLNPLAIGIGAAGGGAIGATIGTAVGGKKTGIVGAVAGAVTGALIGDAVAEDLIVEDLIALEQRAAEALGEAPSEHELPDHYSWQQLQALSKPQ